MDLITVVTANVCPFCGGALELVEDATFVWFGCRRCMRYVKRDKRSVVKRYVDYREKRFDWSGMMAELYQLYKK
jgi:RNA polymerase subunit RPABC4/transcription elongation factor Spt4